jgi:hypothetical protein
VHRFLCTIDLYASWRLDDVHHGKSVILVSICRHASHLAEWFSSKTVCPVAECMCHCAKMEGFSLPVGTTDANFLLHGGTHSKWGFTFQGGEYHAPSQTASESTASA